MSAAAALPGPLVATVLASATPLALAALGELVAERAGVINLGVEGMMLSGAVCGFWAMSATGSHALGVLAGAGGGIALALAFAVAAIALGANQVASGLAVTILGTGLSALLGRTLTGRTVAPLPRLHGLGPVLHQDPLALSGIVAAFGLAWLLRATRAGLVLRAVGENAEAAHRMGLPVRRIRTLAVLFGGAMAGLGGADLSLSITPLWADGMTAGRGWIALALVVFGAWRPLRVLAGAWLFGGVAVGQLALEGSGLVHLPGQVVAMAPYLATILALVALARGGRGGAGSAAPACLGRPFRAMV